MSMEKFDGNVERRLTSSEVKQIAGRAGRYGTANNEGTVTCLNKDDLDYLHECLKAPVEELETAGLGLESAHVEVGFNLTSFYLCKLFY